MYEVCSNKGRGKCVESSTPGTAPQCVCNPGWIGKFCQNTDGNHTVVSWRCNPQVGNYNAGFCGDKMGKPAYCLPDNANCDRDENENHCKTGWCVLKEGPLKNEEEKTGTGKFVACNLHLPEEDGRAWL